MKKHNRGYSRAASVYGLVYEHYELTDFFFNNLRLCGGPVAAYLEFSWRSHCIACTLVLLGIVSIIHCFCKLYPRKSPQSRVFEQSPRPFYLPTACVLIVEWHIKIGLYKGVSLYTGKAVVSGNSDIITFRHYISNSPG